MGVASDALAVRTPEVNIVIPDLSDAVRRAVLVGGELLVVDVQFEPVVLAPGDVDLLPAGGGVEAPGLGVPVLPGGLEVGLQVAVLVVHGVGSSVDEVRVVR